MGGLISRLVFPVPRPSYSTSALAAEADVDIVFVPGAEGRRIPLASIIRPNPSVCTHTVIYSHGNAEDMGDVVHLLRRMSAEAPECQFLTYEYTGYGPDNAREAPSEDAIVSNARHVARYAAEHAQAPLVFYGRSLGSHMAIQGAEAVPERTAAVVLESPPMSCISTYLNTPLVRWRPLDYFVNTRAIRALQAPLLVIHGTADKIIPFSHGKRLYERHAHSKDCLWIEGGGHNDLHGQGSHSHDQIVDKLRHFLHDIATLRTEAYETAVDI